MWAISEDLNAEQQYEKFLEIYMSHYYAAFSLKSKRVRRKKERLNPKPWILPWLEDVHAIVKIDSILFLSMNPLLRIIIIIIISED